MYMHAMSNGLADVRNMRAHETSAVTGVTSPKTVVCFP